jgi:trehalose synthase
MKLEEKKPSLDHYKSVVQPAVLDDLRRLADKVRDFSVQHINATRVGGGVAEILHKLVPLMEDLGIETHWDVMQGDDQFFEVTKAFHNALHGENVKIKQKMIDIYRECNRRNASLMRDDADVVVIHDPQPLGMIEDRSPRTGQKWVWRCHIDLSRASERLWDFLTEYITACSASIFSMPEFSKPLPIPQYMICPSIDPLSDKNKPLSSGRIKEILIKHGVDPERPILTQVSRFDRLKDPMGVIEVYKKVRRRLNLQLVLAGGAADDDPEGQEVLAEIQEKAADDPDIHILNLPPFSDLEINALQRGSDIIIQKSIREGFGLTVTEALWKGKPVVASAAGGIKRQIIHNVTGISARTTEACAFNVRQLLTSPGLAKRLGRTGKMHVANNFLITRHLRDYLLLFLALRNGDESVIFLD